MATSVRRRSALLAIGVALLGVGGCTSADVTTAGTTAGTTAVRTAATDTVATTTADRPDETVVAIVADLNDYWEQTSVELGFDYEPVPLDRLTTGSDGALCSGVTIPASDVEENAFVDPACEEGITVAYDPAYVGVSLARAEATLAHEWGHVVQAQASELDISLDPEGLPIDAELQADCFAGAWAAQRAQADIELLRQDTADTGDTDDVPIDDPDAHGLPEERVIAFDIGVDGGPVACVDELVAALP